MNYQRAFCDLYGTKPSDKSADKPENPSQLFFSFDTNETC